MTNPTLTEKDVAEIAGKLSAKMRNALLTSQALPSGTYRFVFLQAGTRKALTKRGLADPWGMVSADVSDLGLAVRNHLISTPNMPKGDQA